MSRLAAATLLAALTLSGGGCAQPQTATQLNDRLTNATQINDGVARDDALERIAGDAANAAQPQLCLSAVGGIVDLGRRDRTAKACADTFDGNGDRATAELLVAKIADVALRDRMREAYADEPPPAPAGHH